MSKHKTILMNFIEPDNWIFQEYRKVFGHFIPAIYAQEKMLDEIKDKVAWQRTCDAWGMNHYKPSSVGKMLAFYHEQVAKQATRFEAINVKSRVGKYDDTSTWQPEPPCQFCGKQWCLDTHRKEMAA